MGSVERLGSEERLGSDEITNEGDFSIKVMSMQMQAIDSQRNTNSTFNQNFFRFKAPPKVELNDVENSMKDDGSRTHSRSNK